MSVSRICKGDFWEAGSGGSLSSLVKETTIPVFYKNYRSKLLVETA